MGAPIVDVLSFATAVIQIFIEFKAVQKEDDYLNGIVEKLIIQEEIA